MGWRGSRKEEPGAVRSGKPPGVLWLALLGSMLVHGALGILLMWRLAASMEGEWAGSSTSVQWVSLIEAPSFQEASSKAPEKDPSLGDPHPGGREEAGLIPVESIQKPFLEKIRRGEATSTSRQQGIPQDPGGFGSESEKARAKEDPRLPGDPPLSSTGPGHRALVLEAYLQALYRNLAQYREYPFWARLRGLEGVVVVGFTLDREGHLLRSWVVTSSGHRSLDRAALRTLERVERYPPLPREVPGDHLTLRVPLVYRLVTAGLPGDGSSTDGIQEPEGTALSHWSAEDGFIEGGGKTTLSLP